MVKRYKKDHLFCVNCGYRIGLHEVSTGRCPNVKPIPNTRMTGVYGYLETVFSDKKEVEVVASIS